MPHAAIHRHPDGCSNHPTNATLPEIAYSYLFIFQEDELALASAGGRGKPLRGRKSRKQKRLQLISAGSVMIDPSAIMSAFGSTDKMATAGATSLHSQEAATHYNPAHSSADAYNCRSTGVVQIVPKMPNGALSQRGWTFGQQQSFDIVPDEDGSFGQSPSMCQAVPQHEYQHYGTHEEVG